MLAAIIRSGEERILVIEGDRPDGPLNDVGIDLDPAIIEKANKTVPTAEAIADRVGDRALPGHGGELGLQPDLELSKERLCPLSSNAAAHLRFLAAHIGLWSGEVAAGRVPSEEKQKQRKSTTLQDWCTQLMTEHGQRRPKALTAVTYRGIIDNHIVPLGGKLNIDPVTKADVKRIMRSVEEPLLILIEPIIDPPPLIRTKTTESPFSDGGNRLAQQNRHVADI